MIDQSTKILQEFCDRKQVSEQTTASWRRRTPPAKWMCVLFSCFCCGLLQLCVLPRQRGTHARVGGAV